MKEILTRLTSWYGQLFMVELSLHEELTLSRVVSCCLTIVSFTNNMRNPLICYCLVLLSISFRCFALSKFGVQANFYLKWVEHWHSLSNPPFVWERLVHALVWSCASGLLSPKGVNYEVQALMNVKGSLVDPRGAFYNWDGDSVDPCSWAMVTCSPDSLVVGLASPSQNLSGTVSPSIGNLTNLKILLLQNNNISGPIPQEIEPPYLRFEGYASGGLKEMASGP